MKHSSTSSTITILLALLATTAAFSPSQQRSAIGRPSISTFDVPDTAAKMKMWQIHASNDNEMERSLNNDAGAALSNIFATASISMAALLATGSALSPPSPANAVDVSQSFVQTTATTTTIAAAKSAAGSQSPTLFEFLKKKRPDVVVISPKDRTIQTTSPSLAKFLNCKLIEDPVITGDDVNKIVNDSITLVLTNKLIFLTGTVVTITAMYFLSYQYYLNQINMKNTKKA